MGEAEDRQIAVIDKQQAGRRRQQKRRGCGCNLETISSTPNSTPPYYYSTALIHLIML
jgi:hypothetical protein